MHWAGVAVAALLLVLFSDGAPQQGSNNVPFTAFGSEAQQRHRQRQQELRRQQASRQGAGRLLSNNPFPVRSSFKFGTAVQQPFTVFRQPPPIQPSNQFRPPVQPQFGQFRPIASPGFQTFGQPAFPPTTEIPTVPPTQAPRFRPRPRATPKTLFSFRITPEDSTTTTTTTTAATTTSAAPEINPTIRSNEVTVFESSREGSRFEFPSLSTTVAPAELEPTTVNFFSGRGSRRFNGAPVQQQQFVTESPLEFQTEFQTDFTTEQPVNELNFTSDGNLFDFDASPGDEFDSFSSNLQGDYEDENDISSATENSFPSTVTFGELVDPVGETFSTTGFPSEVVDDFTTERSLIQLDRAPESTRTFAFTKPEITTASPAFADSFELQTDVTPTKEPSAFITVPTTEAANEVTGFFDSFSNDSTEQVVLTDSDDQSLQSLEVTTAAVVTTPAPTAAPTVSDEELTTAITAPPTNRVTRETTPLAVRPTRPSFPRRGLSSDFRSRLRNRNRGRDRTESDEEDEPTRTADPAPTEEPAGAPRRLSLRERLLQATKSQVAASSPTERPAPSTAATARTTSETATVPPPPEETTTSRRFSPPSRRPRPPVRTGGSGRGGLASLLVKQLKDESPASSSTTSTSTSERTTTTSTATTTTSSSITTTALPTTTTAEAEEPPNTGRKAPSRGGLAAILSGKGSGERSQRPGLSSLIERLRGRTSTTEKTTDEERAGKALRTDSDRQRPFRPTTRSRLTTTETTTPVPETSLDITEEDVSAFLPPGFKPVEDKVETTTLKSEGGLVIIEEDINPDLLPEGFKEKIRADLESSSGVPRLTPPPSTSPPKVDGVEDLSAFLPPGFQLAAVSTTTSEKKPTAAEEDVSALLLPGYQALETTTVTVIEDDVPTTVSPRSESSTKSVLESLIFGEVDDVSAFLPPGYKPAEDAKESEGPGGIVVEKVDPSSFLPPGYKPTEEAKEPEGPGGIAVDKVDPSSFLPPGYKPPKEAKEPEGPGGIAVEKVNPSSFLPPGYKPPEEAKESESPAGIVIDTVDASAFLPPGYKPGGSQPEKDADSDQSSTTTEATTEKPKAGGIVFPGGRKVDRKPATLPKIFSSSTKVPPRAYEIDNSEDGLFSRLGERPQFTGWSTEATTPLAPIERTTFTTTTRATTTTTVSTTTTTRRPTTPGVCSANCRMASSVRIVEGMRWRPELAIRGTPDWEDAADLVTLELTEAFQASKLNAWFDRVVIDAFSEGSVIADYYLVFNKLIGELDTRDVNVLFKESLPTTSMEMEDGRIRELLRMGSLTIDPGFTDFVVQKEAEPVVVEEDNYLIPEWSIAVIVIGLTALLFMLIFGIVLMWNRRKRSGRGPRTTVPLTADMLNELDKSHMAGVDNYGADEVYDPDDAWNNEKVTYDRRLRSASREKSMDYKNYNIYDSWRSDMSGPHGSAAGWSRKKIDNFDDDPDDF